MKVRVLKKFIDKETDKLRKVDEEFECSQERYDEILKKGKLIEVVEPEGNPGQEEVMQQEETPEQSSEIMNGEEKKQEDGAKKGAKKK